MKAYQSLLLTLFLVLAGAVEAQAAVVRYAVLIGNNRGDGDEADLRFADSDAERMHAVLKAVGGFPAENMIVLKGERAPVVQRTLISFNDRIRAAQGRPDTQVMLFVYYSGHADALALHLDGTQLELVLLEQLVRSSAAAFRVLVLDACRSGSLTRVKGGKPVPAFSVRVDESLDGEGTVFLTSSSANEDAQESDLLGGSFFTHYLRSGLLGPADDDGNGRITLDEAYRYAHTHTVRASSRTLAGTQHPTYRYELRGQGRIALTEPIAYAATRGSVRFPPGKAYLVLHGDENGQVVGEVGVRDARRTLSVAPGRYFVRGRAAASLLEGVVSVRSGELIEIDDASLRRVDYARLARKGTGERSSVHGPLVGYSLRTALRNSEGPCHGVFAGYGIVFPAFTLSPRIEACRAGFENAQLSSTVDSLDLGVRAAHAWDISRLSLDAGAELGPTLQWQRFETRGLAPPRTTLGGRFGLSVGASLDLGDGFDLVLEAAGETHVFALEDHDTGREAPAASLAVRQRIGISKLW